MESRAEQGGYRYTEKFFGYQNNAEETPALDFPLPSDSYLYDFFLTDAGRAYKAGCRKAIAAIRLFCTQQGIEVFELDVFASRYLDYSGYDEEENSTRMPLYTEGMIAMVNISRLIASPHIHNKNDIVRRLVEGLDRCPTGTHTHIINTQCELQAQLNLPYSMMAARKVIAEQHILDLLRIEKKVMVAMEIHYVNAVLSEFHHSLNIAVTEDETTRLCKKEILDKLYDEFIVALPQLLSLEKLLEMILPETGYELLPENIRLRGYSYCADFVTGLNFYGQESPMNFLQLDQVIESKDDFVTYQLCWSAPYVLQLSLLHRLQQHGMVDLQYKEYEFEGTYFYYLPNQPLRFAYVHVPDDLDGRHYQSFLVYVAKCMQEFPDHTMRLLCSKPFNKSTNFYEVLNALIEYYHTLPVDDQPSYYSSLKCIIRQAVPLSSVLTLKHSGFVKLYLADVPYNELARYAKKDDTLLALLSAMNVDCATAYLRYLYKRGRSNVGNLSILEVAASYGLHALAEEILLTSKKSIHRKRVNSSALRLACENGHVNMVVLLLTHDHIDINSRNSMGMSALHLAVIKNKLAIVDLLLSHGADVDVRNWHNESALYFAVDDGSLPIVKLLLAANANPDQVSPTGKSMLEKSMYRYDIAAELVYFGADVNRPAVTDWLLFEAVKRNDEALVRCIIPGLSVAQLNYTNEQDETLLYLAAVHGCHQIAKKLLKSGCDVDGYGDKHPIHVAIKNKDMPLLLLLLDYHANPKKKFNDQTSMQLAVEVDNLPMIRVLEIQEMFYDECTHRDEYFTRAILRFQKHAALNHLDYNTNLQLFCAFKYFMLLNLIPNVSFNDSIRNINNLINKVCKHYIHSGYIQTSWIQELKQVGERLLDSVLKPSMSSRIYGFFGIPNISETQLFNLQTALEHTSTFQKEDNQNRSYSRRGR